MLTGAYVLLVEDDADDVFLVERAFKKAGLEDTLKVVRDGDQAIAYLAGTGAYADRSLYPQPFLVLLDLKMPGKDGFDVLRWIETESSGSRVLVAVLTSSNLQSDVDKAYELGANSYLVKPIEAEEVTNLVQRFQAYWTEINRLPGSQSAEKPPRTVTTLQ